MPGESSLELRFLNHPAAGSARTRMRTERAVRLTQKPCEATRKLICYPGILCDPDRSISCQLSDVFSIVNKPSGAAAP